MCLPIVLVLLFRLSSPWIHWSKHNVWGGFIAILMSTYVFSVSITEIPFFPIWTGMGEESLLLLLWVFYGQICANMGRLGGIRPRVEPFFYGSLCGLWASVQTYKSKPKKIGMAFAGACLGRVGIPILLFFSDVYTLIPLAFLSSILLYFFMEPTEKRTNMNRWLWCLSTLTWLLCWYDPWIGLLVGCTFGIVVMRSLRGWIRCLSFWGFGVLASSLLAGVGFLEICTRYMEGGVMGEQLGLSHDIIVFSLLFSLFSDPIVSALSMQGLWERALDVQHLSITKGLFIGSAVGQLLFVFYAAGCFRTGKWVWSSLLIIASSYVFIWEILQ